MPNRTVSVRLEANVGGFVAGAHQAETASRALHTTLTHLVTAFGALSTAAHANAAVWAHLSSAMHGAGSGSVNIVNQFHNIDNSVHSTTRNVQNFDSSVHVLNRNMAAVDGSHAAHEIARAGFAAERSRALLHGLTGALVGLGGIALLGAGIKSAMTEGMDFTNSLNTMGAVSHATAAQMAEVAQRARELGRDSTIAGASSVDAASAMTELAKAGFTVDQSLTAAKGTLQLAAAAQVEAAQAAEIEANALNAFGLKADKAAHVADLLANAANASSAEITDFAWALKSVGSVANNFGISIDETTTALGLFANAGVKGSDAGTMLKTGLLSLANPSGPAKKAIDRLGLSAFDATGKFVGLKSVFEQLHTASKKMTQQQYLQATAAVFGTDAARMAGFAAQISSKQWDAMATSLGHTGGASELAAAKMKGLPGTIEAFKNTLSDVKLSIYNAFGPVAAKFVGLFTEGLTKAGPGLEKFSNWAAKSLPHAFDVAKLSVQDFFKGFAGGDISKLDGVQAKIATFGKGVRDVFDNVKSPIKNIWAAVTELASPFLGFVKAIGPFAEVFGKSLIASFQAFGVTLNTVAPFVAGMLNLLTDALNALRPVLQWVAPALALVWAGFKGYTIIKAASLAVLGFGRSLGAGLGAGVGRAATALAMFNMRGGATYAQTAAWAGRIQTATSVATRLGNALPIVGLAAVAFGSVLEMQSAKLDAAAKRGADLAGQFRQGGNAAKQAALEVAQAEAMVNKERQKSAGSQALDIVTFQSNGADEAAAKVKAYKSAMDDWNKTASVTEKNSAAVSAAEDTYQQKLQQYGSTTAPAVIAASQALTLARANQKTAADALAQAEKSITERMLEQTNAILAAANAEVAKTQATAAVNAAELSYIDTMKNGNTTSADRLNAINALITADTHKTQTALDAAKGEGEQQKAISDSIDMMVQQKKTIEAAGQAFPPAAQEMLSSLILTRAGVSETSGVFEALKGHILGIPNSKTIKTTALTQDTIDKLRAVGLSVQENAKDHTFTVTANYVEIHTRYDGDTRFTGGHAKGGWIHGPGTTTSDSILTPLSKNEFVVNAEDAQKNASLLERINKGGGVMGTGKLGMPQYAELSSGPAARQSLGSPARPIVINLNHSSYLDGKVVARSVNRYNADLDRRR